ncbi:MAG: hypothetical protein QXF82_11135 [Nitrososphaeria archaeon]
MENSIVENSCDILALFYILSIFITEIQYLSWGKVNFFSLLISLFLALILNFILNSRKGYVLGKEFKAFFVFTFFYFIVLYVYLYAFPFFPLYFSVDFVVHLSNSLNLINNIKITHVPPVNAGISLLLAGWLSLSFENILFFSRVFIAFVIWSSLPFVYFLGNYAHRYYGGIVASFFYVLLNPFLFATLMSTGIYANALGLTLGLATIYWFIITLTNPSRIRVLFAPLFGFALLLAHSSDILIYLTVTCGTFYLIFFEHHYNIVNISIKFLFCLFLGALITFALNPLLILRLPSTLTSSFVQILIYSNEFLVYLLREIPLLQNIYIYSQENIFVLILFVITVLSSFLSFLKKRLGIGIFPFSWLMLIIVVSFFSTNVWRFALLAFIPFCLLTPLVFEKVLLPLGRRLVNIMPSGGFRKAFRVLLVVFCILLFYLPSYANIIVPIYASSWSRPQQEGFYDCLVWFRDYSEPDAVVVCVGGGTYMRFLPVVANRTFLEAFPGVLPEFVYDVLKNYSSGYVVVWNRLHPYNGSFYYVDFYKNCSLFREVWANSEVTVFKLVKRE